LSAAKARSYSQSHRSASVAIYSFLDNTEEKSIVFIHMRKKKEREREKKLPVWFD
jgi:hypothetical protein